MGLITSLSELTYPDYIRAPQTLQKILLKAHQELAEGFGPILTQQKIRRSLLQAQVNRDRVANQEWRGEALPPEQLEDGSLDTTLRIELHNDTLKRQRASGWGGPVKSILITYSEQGILTVRGRRITFQEDIRNGFDMERVETGVAQALFSPLSDRVGNQEYPTS